MTSPFKFNSIDFGPEQEGLVLHCYASLGTDFTQGKKYKVHYDKTGAYLIGNSGMHIAESFSLFMLPLPLPPKQPKVGEVWSFTEHLQLDVFHEDTLYYITKIENGRVYHERCNTDKNNTIWTGHVFSASIEHFLERHIFVF